MRCPRHAQVKELNQRLRHKHITLTLTDAALDYAVEQSFDHMCARCPCQRSVHAPYSPITVLHSSLQCLLHRRALNSFTLIACFRLGLRWVHAPSNRGRVPHT